MPALNLHASCTSGMPRGKDIPDFNNGIHCVVAFRLVPLYEHVLSGIVTVCLPTRICPPPGPLQKHPVLISELPLDLQPRTVLDNLHGFNNGNQRRPALTSEGTAV